MTQSYSTALVIVFYIFDRFGDNGCLCIWIKGKEYCCVW